MARLYGGNPQINRDPSVRALPDPSVDSCRYVFLISIIDFHHIFESPVEEFLSHIVLYLFLLDST